MRKNIKSVSMLLLLGSISSGMANALPSSIMGVDAVQQANVCQGVVKDQAGETVIGASVVVKGTTNGTITGLDGDFSLSNVKKGDILQISFVGYQTIEVTFKGQPLNVTLLDDTQKLDEVVVTSLGY